MTGFLRSVTPGPLKRQGKRLIASLWEVKHHDARQSFAQEGEDLVIDRLLDHGTGGSPKFYVDVGAHHPTTYSNTFYFYRRGWRGINIDPLPGAMETFARERPRDVNLCLGVGESASTLEYYSFNRPALNTFDKSVVEQRLKDPEVSLVGRTQVEVVPLSSILDKYIGAMQSFDFLSIDVEGMDLQVVKSNDWSRFRPRLILAEDGAVRDLASVGDSDVTQFLRRQGYVAVAKTGLTVFYAEESRLHAGHTGYRVR